MAHPAHPPYPGFGNIKGYYLLNNITPETLNSAPYAPWCLSQQWKGNGYINGDFVADNKALCIASNILRNNGQLLSDYWGLDLKYDEINSPLKEKFKELVCPQGTVKGVINILTSWALNAKIKTDLINWNVCDNNLDFTELSKYASYIVHADHYYPQAKKRGGQYFLMLHSVALFLICRNLILYPIISVKLNIKTTLRVLMIRTLPNLKILKKLPLWQ